MRIEHCQSSDSAQSFIVPNYGTNTKPKWEYWFVVDPTERRLEKIAQSDADLPRDDDDNLVWPAEDPNRLSQRDEEAESQASPRRALRCHCRSAL